MAKGMWEKKKKKQQEKTKTEIDPEHDQLLKSS